MGEATLDHLIYLEDNGTEEEFKKLVLDIAYWEGIPRHHIEAHIKARRYDLFMMTEGLEWKYLNM